MQAVHSERNTTHLDMHFTKTQTPFESFKIVQAAE